VFISIVSLLMLGTLMAILQFALERYEHGRTFQIERLLLAAVIVVAIQQAPVFAAHLAFKRGVKSSFLRSFADIRDGWIGMICSILVIFCVQWIVYRFVVKDANGGALSWRGNFWLAALPTLAGLIFWAVVILTIGALFGIAAAANA
jgi:hypothetical protein